MRYSKHPWRVALIGAAVTGMVWSVSGVVQAAPPPGGHLQGAAQRQIAQVNYVRAHPDQATTPPTGMNSRTDGDIAEEAGQYDAMRSAPGGNLSGQALISAQQQAAALPTAGGSWQPVTTEPYNAQPSNYTDPNWGNQGAGFSIVGGRVTALATTRDGAWFAGTADGGVWRSYDQGQHWTPLTDQMPTLSIGALATDPADGSLWVGTGEANTNQDSYAGTGVYRSWDDGSTFHLVGGTDNNPLVSHTVYRIAFDPSGTGYAATNNGLFRYSPATGSWTKVLPAGAADVFPPYAQQVTDVAVVPGSGGKDVISVIGWRGAPNTPDNGFFESTDFGRTFTQVTTTGAILPSDFTAGNIGRATFAYSADGSKLYAMVESPNLLSAGDSSVLQGIYVSAGTNGQPASVAGPWTQVADTATLAASGSGLLYPSTYEPGVQAWYNQFLIVDPSNPDHVYAGLEEAFQTTDGGSTWTTASPYWNYNLACESGNTCPNTTHPDQHAAMITDGKIVIGNDGGVYSRPLSDTQQYGDWTDLNATLHDLQFYDARAGQLPGGGTAIWGGMQDNGSGLISPGNNNQMVEPAGGDGFDVVVDPGNANNLLGEYADGVMYSSTDGGHAFNSNVSPGCVAQGDFLPSTRPDCDAGMRFITPLAPDASNVNTWVAGGEDVWVTTKGWSTNCNLTACDWQNVYDTGAGNAVTAVASTGNGSTIYAAWVGGGGNPGPAFASGIATNYGGTWHQLNMAGLPDRFISGVTVDPGNPAHAYAVFNGYSRRWIPGGGVGHVFETFDGGKTWTDISGNLPDIASDALVLSHHRLALATDMGVFTAGEGHGAGTRWSRLGYGLPNAAVDDLTVGPDGFVYAPTHGRGIWRIRF